MNKPLLIVLTPVRNEAWILHAFLKATSLWADYIIIADQMSIDGSRDIYPQYDKVIVVDNPCEEMHQARTRQLLFEAVKKIEGDKILFALDADEFLSGDFINTHSWDLILNSQQGDVFLFRWMNLLPGGSTYTSFQPYYWAAHIGDNFMNGEFPDNHIHEWRLPWPNQINHEYIINEISFIHFARVNVQRQMNKELFYKVSTAYKDSQYSGVKMFRHYSAYYPISNNEILEIPNDTYSFYEKHGFNIWSELDLNDSGQHYVDKVLNYFQLKGLKSYAKLDIWNKDFLKRYNLKNPQSLWDKLIMRYLYFTKAQTSLLIVRVIDYFLKKIY